MTIGIVGRKAGMTRIFQDDGVSVPVTVISVEPNRVTQVKTLEADGYRALQHDSFHDVGRRMPYADLDEVSAISVFL